MGYGVFHSHLYVHVQSVVEITEPEEMCEPQRNVKGVQLFVSQRELTQDVQIVLIPPVRGQRSLMKALTANQTEDSSRVSLAPVDLFIA